METREIKISRETAERWYNGNDKELKELALQTYPELEPKYEVGKWYKGEEEQLFKCTTITNYGKPLGYGWSVAGVWFDFDEAPWRCLKGNHTEATHEEVEQRFKEEAEKRGYYDKPFVCLAYDKVKPCMCLEGFTSIGRFWTIRGCVFYNGKWAEFAKEPEYKIGEVYAFADTKDNFKKGHYVVGVLENVMNEDFKYKRKDCGQWRFIRKIEYKFLD
jgi:hypothetical protein